MLALKFVIFYKLIFVLDKAIVFDGTDEEIMSAFTDTTCKVVLKNFKKLDENDLSKFSLN